MDLSKINLEKMVLFQTISKLGSITSGAKELNRTSHSIYYDLSVLEKVMSTKLYYSGKKTFILTDEGNAFLEFCKLSIDKFNSISQLNNKEEEKELVIHTTGGMAYYNFPKALIMMQKSHPKIKINIFAGPEYFSNKSQNFDVMVGLYRDNRSDLIQILFSEFEYGFFASEEYLANSPSIKSLSDFKNHNFLLFSDEHNLSEDILLKFKSIIKSNSYPVLGKLCFEGGGIGSFPVDFENVYNKENLSITKKIVRVLPNIVSENCPIYFSFSKFSVKEKLIRELFSILKPNI